METPISGTAAGAPRRRRIVASVALAAAGLASALLVLGPAWYVYPFRSQAPRLLDLALAVREAAPLATLGLLAACLLLAGALWRSVRGWRRALLPMAPALALAAALLARQNHFEWMFNPLETVAHAPAAAADFVRSDDVVLAVEIAGDAVAWPVRQVAYHHLVQDTVGGLPVVATY